MSSLPLAAVWPCSILIAALVACGGAPPRSPDPATPDPHSAPGYTRTRTGGPHDFDWIAGAWTLVQRRLKVRNAGSNEWDDLPGVQCTTLYLDGLVTADELFMPTMPAKRARGFTVRTFDLEKRQWSIFWVPSSTGQLDTGVFGGFDGNRGEFYGEYVDDGHPVAVRYVWTHADQDHARWEQAFSYDGRSWETNWTADFVRADPATACSGGRPRAAP